MFTARLVREFKLNAVINGYVFTLTSNTTYSDRTAPECANMSDR